MSEDYKFISKFIEGKTYSQLTEEEIKKLESGFGVKKADKEYLSFLESKKSEEERFFDEATATTAEENLEADDEREVPEEIEISDEKEISQEIEEESNETSEEPISIKTAKKGVKVIKAIGRVLHLEDGRTIELNEKELKENSFWRKGEVYYG